MYMIKILSYRLQLGGIAFACAMVWIGVYVTLKQTTNCLPSDLACSHLLSVLAAFAWDLLLKSVIVTALVLMFFPERVYKWWRWFALIAIPYAVWDIITTKTNISDFLGGSSPRTTSDHDGVFFASLSVSIVIAAMFFEKIKRYTFANMYYRVGAYAVFTLLSLLTGVVVAVALFTHYF